MGITDKATIVEVGPRDGFQNIKEWIPTQTKLEVIGSLLEAGFKSIEITSFAHPKAIPQMADAREVVAAVRGEKPQGDLNVLVPNLTGAKAAWESGLTSVTYVLSVSERHNQENVRRTVEQSLDELLKIRKEIPGLHVKADLATAFGCPFVGKIATGQVLEVMEKCLKLGVSEICLCDTIGIANPRQTEELLREVASSFPGTPVSLHFHDTRGMGLANIATALRQGYRVFEAAVGGLGGCPFAPGAAGNVASEDLVNMLEEMGFNTGISLERLLETTRIIKEKITPGITGHMSQVCTRSPLQNRI